jgi:hypothetical protein
VIPWLIGIVDLIRGLPNEPIAVPAIATAGAVGQNCDLTPFVICAMMTPDVDDKCDDDTIHLDSSGQTVLNTVTDGVSNADGFNDCYGYNIGKTRNLIFPCKKIDENEQCVEFEEGNLEAGNFNLLDLDGMKGGKDIKCVLSLGLAPGCADDPGYRNVCASGDTLDTKPGYTWGNVRQGIDYRFDSDTDRRTTINGVSITYTTYKDGKLGNDNRVMAAPIADCTGLQNGNTTDLSKVPKPPKPPATACLFLTQESNHTGSTKEIVVEFTGASCQQQGAFSPTNAVLNGPYKIVLFKSSGSGDS